MSYYSTPSSPIRLPKTQEQNVYEVKQIHDETQQRYALQNGIFDPFNVNTPPNEFMGQLKQRMSVYYGSRPSSSSSSTNSK